MKYSSDGKLRFSQNALQKLTNKFSYINYDSYGRSIESGEITPSGALAFGNVSTAVLDAVGTAASSYLTGTRTDVTVINYDNPESIPGVAGYVQDSYFLSGSTVSNKAKYSADPATASNLVTKTWYNYDGDGNVVWTVKYVTGLGYKTMDYVYDDLGNVTKSIYQKGTAAETMVHYFEYDKNKRLVAAYTNTTDNESTKVLHAKYSYYLHGPLKRVELGDKLQGIDYVYGIDGKLKSINNANATKDPGGDGGNGFAADVFGMNMEYYAGDYNNRQAGIPTIQNGVSTANYSGLINGISWFSKKPNSTDVAPIMNTYSYDVTGQLTENRWGAPNFAGSSFVSGSEINRERGLSYDSHGNIKTLIRTNGAGGELGNYTYNYQANSNKLTSVTGYATYSYDAVGQLASQIKGNAGMYLDYDVSGKVTKICSDAAKQTIILSFVYDDDGNRVMKKDHRTGAVTWYSYDGSGTLTAVFEQQGTGAIQLKEQPVYGSDRLGTFYRLGNNYQYTISDHVGNTRVVINRNKTASGAADIVYYADYYPFGMEVRSGGVESRYGYQGLYAEKDKETGWNNFELRNYDAAIGRWLTTDPYGQYHSPYVGMGNNPVGTVDPDGGKGTEWYLPIGAKLTSEAVWFDGSEERDGYNRIPSLPEVNVNSPSFSKWESLSATESYRRENLFYLRQNLANVDYNDLSRASTSFAIVANVGEGIAGELASLKIAKLIKYIWSPAAKTGTNALVKTGTQFSKHSLERLAQRGVTQDMAQLAISKGQKFYDPLNKSINYVLPNGFASGKSLLVGTNPLTGGVTTVIRSSKNLINSRFVPIK